jgi:hypothetical protein
MDLPPPAARLWALATGHFLTRCLHVAAEIGVADYLGDSAETTEALARKCGCDASALGRILRLLATVGVFERAADGWVHSDLSRLLRSDHPSSMRAFARMMGAPVMWAGSGELTHTARTGETAIQSVVPGGLWAYFKDHPDDARVFDDAMVSKANAMIAALLPAFNFSPYSVIADIGGGRGHILRAILDATPQATGVLFDLPHVLAAVAPSERLALHGGDFFNDRLPQADAYILSEVLHDWPDEEAAAIVRAVRTAARKGSHLLVLEVVLSEEPGPHASKMLDVIMLALTGGRERTRSEHETLMRAGGFRLERVVSTGDPVSVLVGIAD